MTSTPRCCPDLGRNSRPLILTLVCCSFFSLPTALRAQAESAPQQPAVESSRIAVELDDMKVPIEAVWHTEAALLKTRIKNHPDYQPTKRERVDLRRGIALRALEMKLLERFIKQKGLSITKEEAEHRIEAVKKGVEQSGKSFAAHLAELGQTEEEFRKTSYVILTAEKIVAPRVTEQSVIESFQERQSKLPLRKCSHILFAYKDALRSRSSRKKKEALALAEKTLKAIKEGKLNFETYAKEHSDCPSRSRAGDLDYVAFDGSMVRPFTTALYKLPKVGSLSEVVESDFGFHIIKLTAARTFEDYRQRLREGLIRQAFDRFMQQLRLTHFSKARVNQKLLEKNPPKAE